MAAREQETKACVWFTNIDKGLLLNKTNLRTLQGAFGDDDGCAGPARSSCCISIMADFRGKMGPAMRVRIPPPKDSLQGAGVAKAGAKAAGR